MFSRRILPVPAALVLLAASTAPAAHAGPAVPRMLGSYFGNFTSSAGTPLSSDLTVSLQVRRVISGRFTVGQVLTGVPFSGVVNPNGTFRLRGTSGFGATRIRIIIDGRFTPGDSGQLAVIQGRYRITGARRERGTLFLSGASQL